MTAYLDCNATTPVIKEVADLVYKMMVEEYGNSDSRTHEFGVEAKRAVELAREQVADVVSADKTEVIFTSGATESNNIAILGLRQYAVESNKKHIITTKIEHKSVLEPIEALAKDGFDITYLSVDENGLIDLNALTNSLQNDTVLVSIMHVNNETGSVQPLEQICNCLENHEVYLHVDAAQSFGKYSTDLKNHRIDLISASGHKVYAPKGIGTLITRKRGFVRPPLKPLMFGGGQERQLSPGTLAVPLIAGFGLACKYAVKEESKWIEHALSLKQKLISALAKIDAVYNGGKTSPYVLNFSVPGINSEAAMVVLKGVAAVSNGSACTSNSYERSHVLIAMGLDEKRIDEAIRMSWCHSTKELPIEEIVSKFKSLL